MGGFRERIGKYASPSPKANTTFLTDPKNTLLTSNPHGLIDERGCNRNSLRQRFVQSLNRKRSLPAWHSIEYDLVDAASQKQQPLSIRKSISSFSSSLRGRFSSDASADSETQDRRQSVIRKSFGSVSSSLRGIRSSMDSRLSRDRGRQTVAILFGDESVPRSPDLEDVVAAMKLEKSAEVQSPSTLCSASTFDNLDRASTINRPGETTTDHNDPTDRQRTPNAVRFPIRVKRPELVDSETNVPPGTAQNSRLKAEEERQRRAKIVYVFVPDQDDHSKPWPKKKYPDLRTALTDLCTRFKPYYAPFAAYTILTRTIQLFPPNFRPPTHLPLILGSTMFTLQEALDNWVSTLFSRSLSPDEEEAEDSTNTERTFSTVAECGLSTMQEDAPLPASDIDDETLDDTLNDDLIDSDEGFDHDRLYSDAPFIAEKMQLSIPSRTLFTSPLNWSVETLDTKIGDMTIDSSMGSLA
ncbi:hypothetical protein F5Y06DRAFT_307630 [Hypoxylon sp. FL0890]|nr:hypothetical protein F5Y06DRAFT_307630 [Hypoxylon sp. FL0890]